MCGPGKKAPLLSHMCPWRETRTISGGKKYSKTTREREVRRGEMALKRCIRAVDYKGQHKEGSVWDYGGSRRCVEEGEGMLMPTEHPNDQDPDVSDVSSSCVTSSALCSLSSLILAIVLSSLIAFSQASWISCCKASMWSSASLASASGSMIYALASSNLQLHSCSLGTCTGGGKYAHTKVAHLCWGTIVSEVGKHDLTSFEE